MLNSNLTPFLFLAVAAGLFYTYLNPGYDRIQGLRAEEAEYADALDRVGEIRSLRDDLLNRYNDIPLEDVERLEALLPDEIDDVKLLLDLDGIASKYGIKLGDVRVTKPVEGILALDESQVVKPYSNVSVQFTFETTYEKFSAFLREVERSLQLIDVTSIKLVEGESDAIKYTVTLRTYWLKP